MKMHIQLRHDSNANIHLGLTHVYENISLQFNFLHSHLDDTYFICLFVTLCIINDYELLKKKKAKPIILHCFIPWWSKKGIAQKINHASG
jgi:hypothetical protein